MQYALESIRYYFCSKLAAQAEIYNNEITYFKPKPTCFVYYFRLSSGQPIRELLSLRKPIDWPAA
jgi:hypothetical protein